MAMPRLAGGRLSTTWPPMLMHPEVCVSSPAMIRNKVDLPQPEAPSRTMNSPSAMSMSTPFSTSVLPNDLRIWSILSLAMLACPAGGLLHGARGDAADQLPAENQVEDQHRDDRERQGGEHGVPVGDELADEHLRPQRDRLGPLAGRQDQREPEIVPDRDHGEHGHRRHGRAHQRQHDLEEYPVFGQAVDPSGVLEILRYATHELGQDEDRERKALRGLDQDQGGQRVDQAETNHQLQDADRAEAD